MDEPTYTVFVRVPIPRGDFVDPPPVNWDSSRDDALWKILSGAAKADIDWNQVADRFNVPVDFLLKQGGYLTERHASQVRAQVRKATAAAKVGSNAPSPIPGSESAAGIRSLRRDSATRNEGSGPATPLNSSTRPVVSRNASTNTAVLRDVGGPSSPRPGSSSKPPAAARSGEQGGRRRLSSLPVTSEADRLPTPPAEPQRERSPSPGPAESSTASSEDESSPAQSRIIRRPPRFQQQDAANAYEEDEDDESEPAFQPYKPPNEDPTSEQDLKSTLRGAPQRRATGPERERLPRYSQTSDSDTSSAAAGGQRAGKLREQQMPGPLSPRKAAELAGRSPGGKSREGSDGTPSMGSSFSDLDDASVTQSALEEALASHIGRGASSRFSIRDAFRSRYTPSGNQ